MKLYAIRDSKAETFLPILEAVSDDHAKRLIADAIAAGSAQMLAQHPDDYHVYALAEYDNNSGEIQPHRPEPVIGIGELLSMYFNRPDPDAEQLDLEHYNGELPPEVVADLEGSPE